MSDRAAQAAAQSDPWRNANFSRLWGNEAGVGDPVAPMRAWHADDNPLMFTSNKKRRAEGQWRQVVREAQP